MLGNRRHLIREVKRGKSPYGTNISYTKSYQTFFKITHKI